jgi:hypothetical protein
LEERPVSSCCRHPSGWLAVLALVAVAVPAQAGPFTPGDILVTANQTLLEYTPSGTLVQSIPVPVVEQGTGELRDVVVDRQGRAQMWNGTFHGKLTTYHPTPNTFTNTGIVGGLHTVNNVTYGGITVFGHYAFLSTMAVANEPKNGLVRVDVNNLSSQTRFAKGTDFIQVTAGRDGLIYGLAGSGQVDVYNPTTLAFIRQFTPNSPTGDLRDIAVDAQGNVFGVSFFKDNNGNSLYEFDRNGNLLNSLALNTPFSNFVGSTVDLSASGGLVVGSPSGEVFLTNESFTGLTSFSVPGGVQPLFATFVGQPPPGGDPAGVGPAAAAVPEPATGLAVGAGLLVLSLVRRPRRRAG